MQQSGRTKSLDSSLGSNEAMLRNLSGAAFVCSSSAAQNDTKSETVDTPTSARTTEGQLRPHKPENALRKAISYNVSLHVLHLLDYRFANMTAVSSQHSLKMEYS